MESSSNLAPKFCSQCGKRLTIGAKFCDQCGYNLSSDIRIEAESVDEAKPANEAVPATEQVEISVSEPANETALAAEQTAISAAEPKAAPITESESVVEIQQRSNVAPLITDASANDPDNIPGSSVTEIRHKKAERKAQKKAVKLEAKAAKKAKKKGKKALLIVLLALFFFVILPVGGYAVTYLIAKDKATNQEFETANMLLIIKPLTELHDEELVKYVKAGMLMSEGNYRDAAIAFYGFKDDYYDSQDLAVKCSKKFAAELAKSENYSYELAWGNTVATFDIETSERITLEARYHIAAKALDQIIDYKNDDIVDVYKELESVYSAGYEEAYGAYAESKAGNALHTVYQAYANCKDGNAFHDKDDIFLDYALNALSDINEVKDYNSKTASIYEEFSNYIYKIAVDDFDEGYYKYAYEYFINLGSYSYAAEYAAVCDDFAKVKDTDSQNAIEAYFQDAFSYSEAVPNIASVIQNDNELFDRFMLGKWRSPYGSEYYTLETDSSWTQYTFDTNIPIIDHDYNESYRIKNHRLYIGNRKCFTYNIVSFDEISIECERNGKSYVLYRS